MADEVQIALDGRRTDLGSFIDRPSARWVAVPLLFLVFLILPAALHYPGFSSPMIYDSWSYIGSRAGAFAAQDLSQVLGIIAARPLLMITFYWNHMLTGMDPYYFRLFNTVVLSATASVLVFLSFSILEIPALRVRGTRLRKLTLSVFVGAIFVVHPLQTFVALYIIQREAIMACFFYFSALALYVSTRSRGISRPGLGYAATGFLFLAGMLSKENLITLPAVLVLAEVILFRENFRGLLRRVLIIAAVTIPPLITYVLIISQLQGSQTVHPPGIVERLFHHYRDSGLTPREVLLTECRVLFSYMAMIVAPFWHGVQLIRAENVSTSVMEPPATAAACAGILGLIALGLSLIRKRPIASFGILFFLVTVAPESLLIPQFLFFGYRPILPMAGVLLILADALLALWNWAEARMLWRAAPKVAAAALALVLVGSLSRLTLSQAHGWKPYQFWQEAYTQLPQSSDRVEMTPYATVLLSFGGELNKAGEYARAIHILSRAVEVACHRQPFASDAEPLPTGAHSTQAVLDASRLRSCPEMNPDFFIAYNYLGMALEGLGKTSEAIESYREAVKLRPDSPESYNYLGAALLKSGDMQDAVELFQKAVRLQPGYAPAHNNLGDAMLRSGRAAEAVEHFRTAIRFQPEFAAAYNNLGNAFLQMGMLAEAVKHYRRGIDLAPDSAELRNNLGAALLRSNDLLSARDSFEQAVALKPTFSKAQANLGMTLLRLGETGAAVSHLRKAVALDPRLATAHMLLGVALERSGEEGHAADEYSQALAIDPRLVEAHYRLAAIAARRADLPLATLHYEAVVDLDPAHYMAHSALGAIFLSAGAFDRAVEHLRKALAIHQDLPEAKRNLEAALQRSREGKHE
ncbi:MAG: tetratricopeptide repeat protein [Desulfomonile tiedjei]|nr:tetratricopeptide repeat protein [Desulfomonile tiedjei]